MFFIHSHKVSLTSLPVFTVAVATFSSGLLAKIPDDQNIEEVAVHGTAINTEDLGLSSTNGAASRLGLSLMDTPASVELIDKSTIVLKGDYSGLSTVTRATGISSSASPGNGGSSISSRGFNGHSSVVYTYDGTRLYIGAGTVSFPADTWTVDRVEVLRGPGSVINGVGAIGATINYAPKKPALATNSGEIDLTLGSNKLRRLAFGSNSELSEKLALRIDAVKHTTEGYVDRAEEDRLAVSTSLLFQANDNFFATLSFDYADTEAAPYWGTPLVNGKIESDIRRNNYNVRDGLVHYEDTWPRVHLEWQINEGLRFRNDTFYMKVDRHWRNVESYDYNSGSGNVDRSFYLEIIHEQEQLGNRSDLLLDFDLAGGVHSHVSLGAEFNKIDFSHINNSPYSGSTSVDYYAPTPGEWADGVASETSKDYDTDTQQYAIFIDNIIYFNPRWSLVTGVRQDTIDYKRNDVSRSNGQTAGKISNDLSGTSWRLGSVYKPSEASSIYAQASKAVDGIQSILSATDPSLDLTKGEQIEVGIKQQLLNGSFQYTLAVYDITKKNILSQDPGGVMRQIGEQSSQGIELDLFYHCCPVNFHSKAI